MRKRRRSAPLTGKCLSEAGSIALEASLVLPIVLMAIVFFICLIRINAAQMALHGAVTQTVRQAAANIHPIELAVKSASGNEDGDGDADPSEDTDVPSGEPPPPPPPDAGGGRGGRGGADEPLQAVRYLADKLESWIPAPSGPLLAAALKGDWKTIQDTAMGLIGRPIIEPMLRHEADKAILNPERLHLSKLSLPDLKNGSDLLLVMEAEYSFPLGFPFTKKTLVLREQAAERVWVPDTLPARRGDAASEHAPIQIILVEPSPVKRGNKARVVVKTTPGRSLSIQVLYKSGKSVAKHLGNTVTDGDGLAEWTWLVSGNTTPGIWEIIVTASDGVTAARHFVVEKKQERT